MLSALQLELKAGSSKVVGIITLQLEMRAGIARWWELSALQLELKAGSSKVVGIISAAA